MTKRRAPYWFTDPDPEHDIAKLRPESSPIGRRFETIADTKRYVDCNLVRLANGDKRDREIADILDACETGEKACMQVFCPTCARTYRRWCIGQILDLVGSHGECSLQILTLHLKSHKPGALRNADLAVLCRRIRARFRRTFHDGVVAIGGIEAGLKAGKWIIHLHVVVLGAKNRELRKLARVGGAGRIKRALLVQPVKNHAVQLSYLVKFGGFHRPTRRSRSRRSRAYPLSATNFREYAKWCSRYQFSDFLFLFGARRRGPKILLKG